MSLTASELTVLIELCNQTTRNDLNEPGPLWLPVTRTWAQVDPMPPGSLSPAAPSGTA